LSSTIAHNAHRWTLASVPVEGFYAGTACKVFRAKCQVPDCGVTTTFPAYNELDGWRKVKPPVLPECRGLSKPDKPIKRKEEQNMIPVKGGAEVNERAKAYRAKWPEILADTKALGAQATMERHSIPSTTWHGWMKRRADLRDAIMEYLETPSNARAPLGR